MKRTHLLVAMLCAMVALVGCGDKVNADLIIGDWTNTAQSGEITIAGQENIPEGMIGMTFTADSVIIYDVRVNCVATRKHYTLDEKDGKQVLHVDDGCPTVGDCIVEGLTKQKMKLMQDLGPDMGLHLTMKRI